MTLSSNEAAASARRTGAFAPLRGDKSLPTTGPAAPAPSARRLPPRFRDQWVGTAECQPVRAREVVGLTRKHQVTFVTPKVLEAPIYRVSDGDTVSVPRPPFGTFKLRTEAADCLRPITFSDKNVGIRVKNFDTPEKHVYDQDGKNQGEPAEWASRMLAKVLNDADLVEIEPNPKLPVEGHGRILADLYGKPESPGAARIDVTEEMLKSGAGDLYIIWDPGFDEAEFARLSAHSREAVENKRGIYGSEHFLAERPYRFRARAQGRDVVRSCANMETRTLHPPSEAESIPLYSRVWINPEDVQKAKRALGLKTARAKAA